MGYAVFYQDAPPRLPSTARGTVRERDLRKRRAQLGRVRGVQPDIGRIPSEAGGKCRFNVANGHRQPWNRAEPDGR